MPAAVGTKDELGAVQRLVAELDKGGAANANNVVKLIAVLGESKDQVKRWVWRRGHSSSGGLARSGGALRRPPLRSLAPRSWCSRPLSRASSFSS